MHANNALLRDYWMGEKAKSILNYFVTNENKNTTYQSS